MDDTRARPLWGKTPVAATLAVVMGSVVLTEVVIYVWVTWPDIGSLDLALVLICPVPAVLIVSVLVLIVLSRPYMLRSHSRTTHLAPSVAVALAERALSDAGLLVDREEATPAGRATGVQSLALRSGLRLTVVESENPSILYIGPVRDLTLREVRQAEQVIDRALEGMEPQPPSRA